MEYKLKAFAYDVTYLKKGNIDRAGSGNDQNLSSCLSKVVYSRHMDFAIGIGMLTAFQICRRLVKEGVLWVGCPCSQWKWISRGTT